MEQRTPEPTPTKGRSRPRTILAGVFFLCFPLALRFRWSKRGRRVVMVLSALVALAILVAALVEGATGPGLAVAAYCTVLAGVLLVADRRDAAAERAEEARRAQRVEHYRRLARREHGPGA
jgi:peptidoglycan/LPS O-acetylase OafA/YrhL